MNDLCANLEQEADTVAREFAAYFLPLAETERQRTILATARNGYRAAYLAYRRAWCAARESSAGPMVAGRSGYTARQSRQHGRAIDRQQAAWRNWEQANHAHREQTLRALWAVETPEQRAVRVSRKLLPGIDRDLVTIGQIDEGGLPGWDRASFTRSLTGMLHRVAASAIPGDQEAVRVCLRHIRDAQAGRRKPFLAARHRIWLHLPEEERP